MTRPSSDSSLGDEPHLRAGDFSPDRTEERAGRALGKEKPTEDEKVRDSVWDEPGLSRELAGIPPPDERTYAVWLDQRRSQTGPAASWAAVALVALVAAPWAVLGAFWGSGETAFSVLALTVFGPVVEETMKLAAISYVVEKKPFLFRSRFQIGACALASGLAFAAIENVLYLKLYTPHPSDVLVAWRWTICVALHAGCSLVAGLGLMRIWADVWVRRAPARLPLGFPYLVTAVVIHGAYNGFALLLYVAGFTF